MRMNWNCAISVGFWELKTAIAVVCEAKNRYANADVVVSRQIYIFMFFFSWNGTQCRKWLCHTYFNEHISRLWTIIIHKNACEWLILNVPARLTVSDRHGIWESIRVNNNTGASIVITVCAVCAFASISAIEKRLWITFIIPCDVVLVLLLWTIFFSLFFVNLRHKA